VQTKGARVFREEEVRMLVEVAAEVAPVVSEARTMDRFIAPTQERLWSLARNLWWSWDYESTSLFRDLDPVRWRQLNYNPITLLGEIPLDGIERRAQERGLHSRINYAYRWQQEEYLATDVNELAMEPAIGANGEPVMVEVETQSGPIRARVWRMKVGRCDLLLLDSSVPGNAPEDRELTSRLYGGDRRIRVR